MAAKYDVKVYVYDLSKGMMAAMSEQFLGKKIDGLWHTAVVVYGSEYFFGGGIQKAYPGTTQAGSPDKIVNVGQTEVPEELFDMFLTELRGKFTPETYHLLTNNCNHFTDEAAKFLTGTGAPDYVVDLPDSFMSTPIGAMMAPMIDGFYKNMGGAAAPVGGSNGSVPRPSGPGNILGGSGGAGGNFPLD